ncbi:hypothetical protein KX816_09915 [Sphingosinicellaceae bacterium]|nr:hypothetical protein KX816_09915 [Sphingosinicellaceae bacterium]
MKLTLQSADSDFRSPHGRSDRNIAQAFSFGEKCALRNLVLREWRPHLSPEQHHLVTYFFDASIEWGRVCLEATFGQMTDGIRAATQWVLPPVMVKRTQFYEITAALKARGVLLIESVLRKFTRFTINLHWSPAEGVPTMALVLSKARRAAMEAPSEDLFANEMGTLSGSRTTEANRLSATRTTVVPNADTYKHTTKHTEESKKENNLRPSASEAVVHPFIRKRERPTPISSSEAKTQGTSCIRPATEPAPERTAREAVLAVQASDTERRNAAAAKAKTLDTFTAYQATWRAAWAESYDTAVPTWTQHEGHMLRAVLKARLHGNIPARHDFLDFVTRNWRAILATKFAWMTKGAPPTLPTVQFLCAGKFVTVFLDAYAERSQFEAAAMQGGDMVELKRLLAQGLTRDAAMVKIGERRALSVQRTKDTETKVLNADMIHRAEAIRAEVMEQRKAMMRERAGVQPVAIEPPARAAEPFEELAGYTLEPVVLPEFDIISWR